MKLILSKLKREEVETDLDLPICFSLQDEIGNNSFLKITEKYKIYIIYDNYGITVRIETYEIINDYELYSTQVTEELFNEEYELAINKLFNNCK